MTPKASNPYPFVKSYEGDRIFYEFETERKVRYIAYFADYGYMFGTHDLGCNIRSFDLVVVGSLRPPKGTPSDPRIADTVRLIFDEIFEEIENVIVAVYDSTDQAELARRRKFDRWFTESAQNHIEKIDFEVPGEDYLLVSSVFLHISLPNKEAVLDRYALVLEGGNIPLD
jgi:hypothetical protein